MERAWKQPFLLVWSLFVLTATRSSAESLATANSRLLDESLEERLILFPTNGLNEKHGEYAVYPDDSVWRGLKMSGKGKGKGTGKSRHKKHHHYHHQKRKATYKWPIKGGQYKGNKRLPTSGGMFVYVMKARMYKGKGYKGKGWKGKGTGKGWKGKGWKGKGQKIPPHDLPPPTPAPFMVATPPPTPSCNTCRTGCLSIVDFVVVDADQDLNVADPTADYLFSIVEGAAYSLSNLQTAFGTQNFAILCITDPAPFSQTPFEIGSVGMRDNLYRTHVGTAGDNSGKDFNAENSPPYVLADDDGGNYNPTDLTLGIDWSITCQAFCAANLLGDESAAVTRNFQVIE